MADEDEDEDEDAEGDGDGDGEDGEGSKPSGSGSNKKLFIIIGAAALLVIGGIGGAYVAGLLDPIIEAVAGGEPAEGDESATGVTVFYDLPELLVNMNTGGRKSTFLKIRVALELQKEGDIAKIEEMMPRIIDNFQVYLRELRIEDLKGSAGMYRLREELLTRVAAAAAPAQVKDVLFKEMLVQ
jgi:flagellar FliL protein